MGNKQGKGSDLDFHSDCIAEMHRDIQKQKSFLTEVDVKKSKTSLRRDSRALAHSPDMRLKSTRMTENSLRK